MVCVVCVAMVGARSQSAVGQPVRAQEESLGGIRRSDHYSRDQGAVRLDVFAIVRREHAMPTQLAVRLTLPTALNGRCNSKTDSRKTGVHEILCCAKKSEISGGGVAFEVGVGSSRWVHWMLSPVRRWLAALPSFDDGARAARNRSP